VLYYIILNNNQCGFPNKYSTAIAVLELVDTISYVIDNNYYSLGVFIDFFKVFDKLDHNIFY